MKNKCYICNSENIEKTDIKLRDSKDIEVFRCKNCSLEFLSDFSHIDENFYQNGKMLPNPKKIFSWLERSKNDDKRRFEFLKNEIKNKKVLDFGCGTAGFIDLARKIADVKGIEVNKNLNEYFKEKEYKIYNSLDDLDEETFDYITLFHVLEHFKNPKNIINNLKKHLKKDGKLIIEIPNTNDALLSFYKCEKFSDFTHWKCHLFGFNEKNIKKMLAEFNFSKIKIKKVQRYGFLNHIYWIFKGKPNGANILNRFDSVIINYLYCTFLKLFSKTDTLVIICKN